MPLTLNQALFLVLTVAAVVAVVFLVLFLVQLRKTAREGEKTLAELREVAEGLKAIEVKVNARIDDVAEIIESSKKTVAGLSAATAFLTTRVVRPASRFWPLVFPIARLVWLKVKKRKEKRNV
jgi:uncharacterized protein YoxC